MPGIALPGSVRVNLHTCAQPCHTHIHVQHYNSMLLHQLHVSMTCVPGGKLYCYGAVAAQRLPACSGNKPRHGCEGMALCVARGDAQGSVGAPIAIRATMSEATFGVSIFWHVH